MRIYLLFGALEAFSPMEAASLANSRQCAVGEPSRGLFAGPMLLFLFAGAIACVVRFSWLQREAEEPKYSWNDVARVTAIGLGCLAATLLNPNGWNLHMFSLKMLEGNNYIKKYIFEWMSPFMTGRPPNYSDWVWAASVGLLWLGIVLRIRRKPILDVLLACVATYLSAKAWRFYPEFAIFAFPVLSHSIHYVLTPAFRDRTWRKLPIMEAAALLVLIATTASHGFAFSEREHRPIGWDVTGDMPYEETAYILKHGYEGNVFTSYADGAMVIYQLFPRVRPVMDSRIDLFGEELFEEYAEASQNPGAFLHYLTKHDVTIVILPQSFRDHASLLEGQNQWRQVLATPRSWVFVRLDMVERLERSRSNSSSTVSEGIQHSQAQ